MKKLFMAIFMLMPIWCYAQTEDIKKLENAMNNARQNQSSKKQGSTQPTSNSTKGTPTPKNTVVYKSGSTKAPGQNARKYNSDIGAFNKANAGRSCKAGMGTNSFAQQLSAVLAQKVSDVAVIASPDLVWPCIKNGQYQEIIGPTRAHLSRQDFKGENWIVFKDGKAYMDGTPDYNETVQKYLTHERKQILKRVADKYRKENGL